MSEIVDRVPPEEQTMTVRGVAEALDVSQGFVRFLMEEAVIEKRTVPAGGRMVLVTTIGAVREAMQDQALMRRYQAQFYERRY